MKKLFVLAISLAGFAGAKAQENPENTLLVAGEIEANSTKIGESKQSDFQFEPQVGYQWDKNWAAGLVLGIGSTKVAPPSPAPEQKTTNYKVGAFVRYTWPISSIFSIYAQAEGGIRSDKTNGASDRTKKFFLELAPYVGVNVKNNFLLYFGFGGIGFNSTTPPGTGAVKTNKFNFNFGKVISVGVSKNFSLGGKK